MNRLIVTFSARCALSCPYCYAPFNGVAPSAKALRDILHFAKNEKIDILTFGGGDPFQYSFTREALRRAKELGFFVHVDTHGIGFKESDFSLVSTCVDLLGLPLDGPKFIHDTMRRRLGHYDIVMTILKQLLHEGTSVKVNTVVSTTNIESLDTLAHELKPNQPTLWSLYQFLQLPGKNDINAQYSISRDQFVRFASNLQKDHPQMHFEVGTPEKRKTGYLFVQTDGTLFTHSPHGFGYHILGHITSPEWRKEFGRLNQSMLPELSASRYNSLSRNYYSTS